MNATDKVYVNALLIQKYPATANVVKILSSLSYEEINEILSHLRNTYYY